LKTFFLIILSEIIYFFGVNQLELGVDNLSEGWFAVVFVFTPLVAIPLVVFFIRAEFIVDPSVKTIICRV